MRKNKSYRLFKNTTKVGATSARGNLTECKHIRGNLYENYHLLKYNFVGGLMSDYTSSSESTNCRSFAEGLGK